MVRMTRQQGVPVIAVDGQFVVGFDRPRLEALLQSAQQGKVPFGASIADAASYLSKRGQIPVFGAIVGKVAPGSPAERVGLAPGDIITEINLRPVTKAEDVSKALDPLSRGSRLAIAWSRENRVMHGQTVL